MNLTLKQLRAFVAVAESGSFTAAARRLHVTPSALSLTTKELESAIGARLFERSGRRVRLTRSGEIVLRFADSLEGLLGQLRRELDDEGGTRRRLLIGCGAIMASHQLPAVLAEFRRVDADIETVVDIVVSPEDDAEVRRVTLFNSSSRTRTLEVTSFVQKGSPSLLLLDHDYFGRAANYRGGGTST